MTIQVHEKPVIRVDLAIKHFGGREELARFLSISVEAIMNWQRSNRKNLPELRALQVAAVAPELTKRPKSAARVGD